MVRLLQRRRFRLREQQEERKSNCRSFQMSKFLAYSFIRWEGIVPDLAKLKGLDSKAI